MAILTEKNKSNGRASDADMVFVVNGEMIENNGEDWFVYTSKESCGLVGVFDGCGGIGSRKYSEYGNKTGAHVSSRISANAVYDWFTETDISITEEAIDKLCEDIKDSIVTDLGEFEKKSEGSSIKGALTRNFPSTAALFVYSSDNLRGRAAFIWAGDSRGYILNRYGLAQITKDDIEIDLDAFDNLTDDSKLTNMLNSDGKFTLNGRLIEYMTPIILLVSTDGCFGYLPTPMEYEYLLLDTLSASKSIEDWKSRLNKAFRKVTGDDYTLGMAVLGYKSFKQLKSSFAKRKDELYNNYISVLSKDREENRKLWEIYKPGYYRGM